MLPPVVERVGSVFRITFEDQDVAVVARAIHSDNSYVKGELAWLSVAPGTYRLFHQGLLTFNSSDAKARLVKILKEYHPEKPWMAIVEEVSRIILAQWRQGEPVKRLSDDGDPPFQLAIEPFIYEQQPFIFFGIPGTLKSYLALFLASFAALGEAPEGIPFRPKRVMHPLYLDWESNFRDQKARIQKIERGLGKPLADRIMYRYQTASLMEDVDALAEIVIKNNIDLVIIDSLGPAVHQDLNSAESAQEFFRALRAPNCTSIILAHCAKNTPEKTVFGSQYFTALARGIAEVRKYQDPMSGVVSVGIFHRKSNMGPLFDPIGIEFFFSKDAVVIQPGSVADVPGFEEAMPVKSRILKFLADNGPASPTEIATELGISYGSVRVILHRLLAEGKIVRQDRGKYALKEEETKEEEIPF
jgi:DNA-binding transcriptional ArsR family regulator